MPKGFTPSHAQTTGYIGSAVQFSPLTAGPDYIFFHFYEPIKYQRLNMLL